MGEGGAHTEQIRIREMREKDDDEANKSVFLMLLILLSLAYSHFFITKLPKGLLRLFFALPIFYLFSLFPWTFSSSFLRALLSYFITWITSFKLLLFCFHRGPLVSNHHITFFDFLVVSLLPLKLHLPDPSKRGAVSGLTRYELMPLFNHPYLATSLQDFWGRRWNLLSSYILRLSVYDPTRKTLGGVVGAGPAKIGATIATLGVSAGMHEIMMYYITCGTRPTWEVSRFFLLQGFCIVVEAAVRKRFRSGKEWSLVHVALANAFTVGFVVVTAYWLLVLPVLNSAQNRCNTR